MESDASNSKQSRCFLCLEIITIVRSYILNAEESGEVVEKKSDHTIGG